MPLCNVQPISESTSLVKTHETYTTFDSAISDEVYVVVAGKSGHGKSTALNNIFSLDFEARIAATSVTKVFTVKKAGKNGVQLTVIDTPGFAALDINGQEVADAAAMMDSTIIRGYTLLYCISISPSNRLSQEDANVIDCLHSTLGKVMWDKGIILFTNADTVRSDEFEDQSKTQKYIDHIKERAVQLSSLLKDKGFKGDIKTIFEYSEMSEGDVVAIPVGKNPDNEFDILPGIVQQNDDWTNEVIGKILIKTKDQRRKKAILTLKYGAASTGTTAAFTVGGAVLGCGIGATAGVILGPLGVGVGAGTGAAIGAGVGAATGTVVSTTTVHIKRKKRNKAREKLLPKVLQ